MGRADAKPGLSRQGRQGPGSLGVLEEHARDAGRPGREEPAQAWARTAGRGCRMTVDHDPVEPAVGIAGVGPYPAWPRPAIQASGKAEWAIKGSVGIAQ